MTRDELLADLPVGERMETAPGVTVERRSFLATLALAAGAVATPGAATAAAAPLGRRRVAHIDYDEFLATIVPELERRIAAISESGEDHYLHWLASHAVRLAGVAPPAATRPVDLGSSTATLGILEGGESLVALHWQLEPGARIRPHAHTYGSVVTVGLEGCAIVENWEMVGELDLSPDREARFRRIERQLLRPHAVNLVPLSHGYVHGFRAGPAGARFIDFTTRVGPKQKTPYLRIDPEPIDASREEFAGVWYFDA